MILNDSRPAFLVRPKPEGRVTLEKEAESREATVGGEERRALSNTPQRPDSSQHETSSYAHPRCQKPGEGCCFLISVTGSLRPEARPEKHVRLAEQW